MSGQTVEAVVEGKRLSLSNLDKVLYPATGFTKAQVIDYYMRIGPALLPHLRGRALTLKRYPNGVEGEFFYEKACPAFRPDWMRVARLWSDSSKREIPFCLCDDLPTLTWLANLATLELHPSLALAADPSRPTCVAFDLDPGPPAGIVECCHVALWLRELLEPLGLQAFAKTSGAKGMQVYLPLNTPVTYEQTKPFAKAVAELLSQQHRAAVVSNMRKDLRAGKVLIDWSQNSEHKTTVAVYSLRARPQPTASTPVSWDEVARVAESGEGDALVFEAGAVIERVQSRGDLFAPVATLEQGLPPLG